MKKVIELIRVSGEPRPHEQRFNISAQRTINRHTARRFGLTIVHSIELVNVSGPAVLKTPEMQKLLHLIRKPEIAGVVVREFSRLIRPDFFRDYVLLHAFQESGTLLYLPEGPIDFNTRAGRLMGAVRAAIAGLERNELRERIWMGKEVLRRSGKHVGGDSTLPLGVGYDRFRGWFYKPEAQKIKEAFLLFLSGETNYLKISKQLGFNDRTLAGILRNPIHCGLRLIDQRRDPSPSALRTKPDGRTADRPKIKRRPDQVIRLKVIERPLVTEQQFNRVQRIAELKKQTHFAYHPTIKSPHLLNGFLRCGTCGSRLRNSARGKYYVCNNRHWKHGCTSRCQPRIPLERVIDQLFRTQVTDPAFLRRLITLRERRRRARKNRNHAIDLESSLDGLEHKRERILDLFKARLITTKERTERVNAVCRQIEAHNEDLLQEPTNERLSQQHLTDIFRPFAAWRTSRKEQRRNILRTTVAAIHVVERRVVGLSMLLDASTANRNGGVTVRSSMMPFTKLRNCHVLHIKLA
jgi:site-specific DNA recombinase